MRYQKYKYFLLALFLGTSYHSFAQYPSDNGKFEVNVLQGCVPLSAEITSPCSGCDYDFNNDGAIDGTTFTYTEPGTYTVEAFISGGVSDKVEITVHPDTIPQFEVFRCGGRNVELKINDDNYDSYLIEWGDGNSTTISGTDNQELYTYTTSGSKTITLTGLFNNGAGNCTPNSITVNDIDNLPVATINSIAPVNNQTDKLVIKYTANPNALYKLQLAINGNTSFIPVQDLSTSKDSVIVSSLLLNTNYYCFRIATLNACETGNPPGAYSTSVCTQVFNVNFTDNEENILNWTTNSADANGFTIVRDGEVIFGNSTDPSRRSFTDNNVLCNTDYCYTLIANYPSGATSTSLEKCGTAELITTPPAINNIVTQVDANQIDLNWAPPDTEDYTYRLFRSVNNNPYSAIADNIATTQYLDASIDPLNSNCYQLTYEDRCQNTSALNPGVCALRITSSTASLQLIELRWNRYTGYSGGVSHYILEKYDANGSLISSTTLTETSYSDSLTVSDPQEIHYRVIAVPNDGTYDESHSNLLRVIRQALFNAPNAFVPNGNPENSVFKIVTPFLAQIDMRIFNRWGELIYHTTEPDQGWPGTDMGGKPLPQGTYIYQVLMVSEAGEETEAYGTVLLIRK